MSSTERPEADAAEQARPVDPDPDESSGFSRGPDFTLDLEAEVADVLDQFTDAGLPDEDESNSRG